MPYPSEVRAFLKLAEILLTSMLAVWMLPQSCIAKWVASARCGPEVGPSFDTPKPKVRHSAQNIEQPTRSGAS